MPMIKYLCTKSECGLSFSLFYKLAKEAEKVVQCKRCNSDAKKTLGSVNQASKITIDSGFQARAVEVDPNIMEQRKERAYKPPNRGD